MLNQRNRSKLNNLYGTYFSNSLFTDYSNTPKTFETNIKYFYWHDWQVKIKLFITAVRLQDNHQNGPVKWIRYIVLSLKMLPYRYCSWSKQYPWVLQIVERSMVQITSLSPVEKGWGYFEEKKSHQPPHTERPLWVNFSCYIMATFKVEWNT